VTSLGLPRWLDDGQRAALQSLHERNLAQHGTGLLGIVLSGSAARGMATPRSDLDVIVVLSDEAATGRRTDRTPEVDEIPWSWTELTTVAAYGTVDWWDRWSFAWAPVLLDTTGGAVSAAVHRQATLPPDEADAVLIEHDRLDGWVNFAYRALKSDRDGRDPECRLDAAESVPWLLDVVFATAGRVRPYNKYLPWELHSHPVDDWPADTLLELLDRTLSGDADAIRETFTRVSATCRAYDARRGHTRTTDILAGWGDELDVLVG